MDIDIKIGIIQLSSNDNIKDNCRQLEYYFNQCVEKGANFILSPEVSNFISNDENLSNISESAKHIVNSGKEFMFDAEHFFDGYKSNPKYAISCLKAAYDNGARWIVLCDTNGGTLPHEVSKIIKEVIKHIPGKNLGIHAHNDTENAVANSLVAVQAGVRQVQGTLNGLGERCGNANLVSLIPTFFLKINGIILISTMYKSLYQKQ